MATNDPKSRLTEGTLNSPSYTSPNGVTEQRGNAGGTNPGTTPSQGEMERRADETAGEKIGRFFRRAMDRLSGHDEDEWRRGNERNQRDRDTQERYRGGHPRVAVRALRAPRARPGTERLARPRPLARRPEPELPGWPQQRHGRELRATPDRGRGSPGQRAGRLRPEPEPLRATGQAAEARDESRASSGQGPSFENRERAAARAAGAGPGPEREPRPAARSRTNEPPGSERGFTGDRGDERNRR